MGLKRLAAAAVAALAFVGSYQPGEARAAEAFVGVYAHDVTFIGDLVGLGGAEREHGVDLHLGYRTGPVQALDFIWSPQVHAFVSVNSQLKSNFAAVGLNWRIPLGERLYFPTVGVAVKAYLEQHPVEWKDWEEAARESGA